MDEITNIQTNADVKTLESECLLLSKTASKISVVTTAEYNDAADKLKQIKGALSRLETLRKTFTTPLDQAKKAIMDFFRKPEDMLRSSESGIKRAMLAYTQEQERIRIEQQRKLEEEARKERERLQKQAEIASQKGKEEKAEALFNKAENTVAPIIAPTTPPVVSGIKYREDWKFEITNPFEIPREYLVPDEGKIRKVVLALKADTKIPGVRVYSEKTVVSGRF